MMPFNQQHALGNMQNIAIKDNDSLSALLAANIQADLLILMSDVDGIYNKPPWEDGARLMHTYTSQDRNTIEFGKKSKVSLFAVFAQEINSIYIAKIWNGI